MNSLKYFVYVRKSTDEKGRQVQSLESQVSEAKEFASKEGLEIVKVFQESKTAKEPGRQIFNQMLIEMEQGKADGIIAWHPDRLARNSVDGGKVIYMMDTGVIKDLRFPTYWVDNTPQGKFTLSLAFGQSKYYVDSLSKNVKRGMKTKLSKGEWPTKAPPGYINKDKKIFPDPITFDLVKKLFYTYGEGTYNLDDMCDLTFSWGLRSRTGKKLAKSTLQNILTNYFYAGIMIYGGERYQGNHKKMINLGKFLQIQKVLKQRGKPQSIKKKAPPFRGFITCGECGGAITSEKQKGHTYYRCTKKMGNCGQKYVREGELDIQISKFLKKIALKKKDIEIILKLVKQSNAVEFDTHINSLKYWQNEYNKVEEKRQRLLEVYMDGDLPKEDYTIKADALMFERQTADENLEACKKAGDRWLEQNERMVITANMAFSVFEKGDKKDKRLILQSLGSNFVLTNKKLEFTWLEPFSYMLGKDTCTVWLRDMDSNHDSRLQRPVSYH